MNRLLPVLAVMTLIAACKKADDQKSIEDSIRGTWARSTGYGLIRNASTGKMDTINYVKNLPFCVKDDALEFKEDFSGITHLGDSLCNAGDPKAVPFRWETTGNGTGLNIYDATEFFPNVAGNVNAKLLAFTPGSMTLRYTLDTFFRLPMAGTTDTMIVRDTVTFTDVLYKQ